MPDPYLFNRAFGGGVETGSALAKLFREGRERRQYSTLSDLIGMGDYNTAGRDLISLGDIKNGMAVMQYPQQQEAAAQKQRMEHARFDLDTRYKNAMIDNWEAGQEIDRQKLNQPAPPMTIVGEIYADLKAGRITPQQAQALVAKETAPKTGMTFTTPDGSTVQIGGNPGLGKKATNDLQTGIIGNTELLDLTEQVGSSYDPEFLTYQGQGEGFFTKQAEKLGMNPGEARKDFLKRRTKFVTGVERLFNAYRKEITGAAAAVQELDRLKQSFINADMSPSQFEAAFEGYQTELRRMIRLRNKLLREGLDPRNPQRGGSMLDNLFLTGADDDIEARGDELAAQGKSESEILETLEREGYGT